LYTLLRRSYPDLTFIPTRRAIFYHAFQGISEMLEGVYDRLPAADYSYFFDNDSWAQVRQADRVGLSVCLLADVLKDYSVLSGQACLLPDPVRQADFKSRLKAYDDKMLVGLSWRSSLINRSHNDIYFSVEEMWPILALEGVQFVNLQYDECDEELAKIEARFPGKVINFEDLDQFSDMDGVAALLSCLDLLIVPQTAVAELAGAVGCPSLLFSTGPEARYRWHSDTNTQDVFFHSLTHVNVDWGDKQQLAALICEKIRQQLQIWQTLRKNTLESE